MSDARNQSEKKRNTSKLWLPAVIAIGYLIGVLSYLAVMPELIQQPFAGEFDTFLEFHIILSTIGMSLLVALVVVYARIYSQTRAKFVLGLLVILVALLLQSVFNYPVFVGMMEPPPFPGGWQGPELHFFANFNPPFPSGFSSPISDIFMIVAYAIFLYLSLE
jgi:magnesium-transporting ATPase (P-type)